MVKFKADNCLIFKINQKVSKEINIIFICFSSFENKIIKRIEYDLQIELISQDRVFDVQIELASRDRIFVLQIELLSGDCIFNQIELLSRDRIFDL